MKKYLFLGMAAALMFASCSNDEVVSVSTNTNDVIKFSATVPAATRATDLYCNNNLMSEFSVWASVTDDAGTASYMLDNVVTVGANGATTAAKDQKWPADGTLSFYATNDAAAATWDGSELSFVDYTVQYGPNDQEDLLYAATPDQTSSTNGGTVSLNFRHALSQVVFKAKCSNPNLYVEVSAVGVSCIANKGTFTLPSSTENNYVNHSGSTLSTVPDTAGEWSDLSGLTYSIAHFEPVALTSTAQNLTDKSSDSTSGVTDVDNVMILLPQEVAKGSAENPNGFFFIIKYCAYNIADSSVGFNKDTDKACRGTLDAPLYVAVPADIAWEPGYKYIYTFDFADGNGGLPIDEYYIEEGGVDGGDVNTGGDDGDGDNDDSDGEGNNDMIPHYEDDGNGNGNGSGALTSITFSLTIDDFAVTADSSSDVEADYEEEEIEVDYIEVNGLKWATCNLGASSIGEVGKYYAWGEITASGNYTEENCRLYLDTTVTNISGNTTYDAAIAKLGNGWRIPTQEEFNSLIENASNVTWTNDYSSTGVGGLIVLYLVRVGTTVNPLTLFFPAGGTAVGTYVPTTATTGYYWTSNIETNTTNGSEGMCAYDFWFKCDDTTDPSSSNTTAAANGSSYKYRGMLIRPVNDLD